MMRKRGKRFLLLRYIQKNDVVLRIYTSFAFLLTLTGVLIGIIFMMLYEKNYVHSYVRLLTSQGKAISKRVSGFASKDKAAGFGKYINYIDEMEQAENTDVWVVTNREAEKPLGNDYVNAQIEKTNLSEDMVSVVEQAFLGKTTSSSSHDKVYGGMTTLCVAVPVKDRQTKEVVGAVIMVSMIDRQTMGLREGRYLITLSVIAAIILSYLVAVVFSRFLSRPLEKIGKRISALAGGDYTRINVKSPYGHWKDNGIKVEGEAVWSYIVMYLTMCNSLKKEYSDYRKYKYKFDKLTKYEGIVAPYAETPLDDEQIGEDIYLNIINQSHKYIYIFTPYLIIDTDLMNALILAAKRGVDVRIIIPGIPDKKIVYTLTESYLELLIKGGVKIYKYTPGFIHSKVFIADDHIATVGTINLDYRSLYLHFECGLYLENVKCIQQIKEDALETMEQSHLVTKEEATPRFFKSVWQGILRLFAPLL